MSEPMSQRRTPGPDSALAARIHPSPNYNLREGGCRPSILLLHYTGMPSAEGAIHWLAAPESKVSCHYVVAGDGAITQMVAESCRAWHAGVSHWQGATDINSRSIGIEIHNPGHDGGYPDFPEAQMVAVEALCLDIAGRHGIKPQNVLAHSDVAPRRKRDPGEKFGWARLARAGIGHWTEPVAVAAGPALERGASGDEVLRLQKALAAYGYGVPCSGEYCEDTEFVVTAFQRHFRPALVDGRWDRSTQETLQALLGKLA
jgi:N-acetylmuramoyl-L-alanine amidase